MRNDEFEVRLRDLLIPHLVYLTQYSTGLKNRMVRSLNGGLKALEGQLAARLVTVEERGIAMSPATQRRLKGQIKEIKALVDRAYTKTNAELLQELGELASDEAVFVTKAIKTTKAGIRRDAKPAGGGGSNPTGTNKTRKTPSIKLEVEFPTKSPSPVMVKSIVETRPMSGRHLKVWADKLSLDTQLKIEQTIQDGMQAGKTTDAIVRDIIGSKRLGTKGILEASRSSMEALVRTSVTHIHNVAAQASYMANDDVVKGWKYLSVLDSRTTVFCAAHDGKIYELGKGPIPPNHVRCRSICQPSTVTMRELGVEVDEAPVGKRASADGPVRGDLTYDGFLRTQSKETQDKMLGKARGAAFRTGKIKMEDLIKADGRELTLKELRALHPAAF